MPDVSDILATPDTMLRTIMERIDQDARGIALITDDEGRLIETITDGDIRRCLLGGAELDDPVSQWLEDRGGGPVTASSSTPERELIDLMESECVWRIPLLDGDGRVTELATYKELTAATPPEASAVIMAGGFGTRLRPRTREKPKPLLEVGDKPIMERIVEQLHETGIQDIVITTHYLGDAIREHFGDGSEFGVDIGYVEEEEPLGTAGSLNLIEPHDGPLLVINGDVLTTTNFDAMIDFHREQDASITMGVSEYDIEVPYGVVETDGTHVEGLREKPVIKRYVNAGLYVLDPEVRSYIPSDEKFDMTDLIEEVLDDDRLVTSFPIVKYWLDIGQDEDFKKAQRDVERWRSEDGIRE